MKTIIAVAGRGSPSPEEENIAFQVGKEIAKSGAALLCGGLGGVMEAAAKGAKSEGGATIGILPGKKKRGANPYIDFSIPTGLGEARNLVVALGGVALIAVGGGWGTLSEVSFAAKNGIPVIGLNTWVLDCKGRGVQPISMAGSPKEAVEAALRRGGRKSP